MVNVTQLTVINGQATKQQNGKKFTYRPCYALDMQSNSSNFSNGEALSTKEGNYMTHGKSVRVAKCPINQEYCNPSCYFRKGNRCYFKSKRGRQIPELKGGK
jgi:hypothetical protein